MMRPLTVSLAMLLIAACAPGEDTPEGTPPPGDFLVPVTLTEHEIEIAAEAPAGELTFQLTNEGDQVHGFVIQGEGIDETLTTDVQPGATETVTIELEPGSYTLWCPIGDHRDRGMEAELAVTEARTDAGAPPDAVEPSEQEDIGNGG